MLYSATVLLLCIIFCHGLADPPPVISDYNATAYLGVWYQIADKPQFYEILCGDCTRATYGLNDNGTISVSI